MLCPKCGVSNPENNNFCQSCGASLKVDAPDSQLVPRQPLSTSLGAPAPPPPVSPSAPPSSPLTPPSQPVTPSVSPSASPLPSAPVEATNLEYVGFWKRLLAYTIDGLILGLIGGGMGFYFNINVGNTTGGTAGDMTWLRSFISFIVGAGYYVFFWVSQNGQTLGNKLLAIRVVREDNHPLDIGTGVVRYIGYLISIIPLGLGFLWVAWDGKKQGWHDKIAKTIVVKTEGKSHVGIAIVIVIGYFMLIILAVAIIAAVVGFGAIKLTEEAKKTPDVSKEIDKSSQLNKITPTVSQLRLDLLARETFWEVNKYREGQGLPLIQEDQKLCAYAQRRVEQLTKRGSHDQGQGFLEDTSNPVFQNAYFSDYSQVGEDGYSPLYPSITAGDVINSWVTRQGEAFINDASRNGGCIRADGQFLTFIAGIKK